MKKRLLIYLSCALFPLVIFAQRGKNMKYKTINVATTINYYPTIEPYSFSHSFLTNQNDLVLNYLTEDSGTFFINEGNPIFIDRALTSNLPSQLLSIGASVQIINENSSFHELSLTKLSFYKSSYSKNYFARDTSGIYRQIQTLGYDEKTAAYAFRYEFGKLFGDPKRSSLRFGVSGAIEPSLYTYKRISYSSTDFPLKARIMTIDIALIPMVSAKISKKLSMDFKIIPNMLLADFGNFDEDNPILPVDQRHGTREYNLPEVNVAFSFLLRYKIQEPQKRRRRRSDP